MMLCGGNPMFLFIEIVRALKNAENHTFEKLTIFLSGEKLIEIYDLTVITIVLYTTKVK